MNREVHVRFWESAGLRCPAPLTYSRDGACTNQAESFFSRMRRADVGIHHHIAGLYLRRYAAEMGWREDRRVTDNSRLTSEVVPLTLGRGHSVDWRGYWRRWQHAA